MFPSVWIASATSAAAAVPALRRTFLVQRKAAFAHYLEKLALAFEPVRANSR
jgi:hypothetical protein